MAGQHTTSMISLFNLGIWHHDCLAGHIIHLHCGIRLLLSQDMDASMFSGPLLALFLQPRIILALKTSSAHKEDSEQERDTAACDHKIVDIANTESFES